MGEVIKVGTGKLKRSIDLSTNKPYDDWREDYINTFGIIYIAESKRIAPGKKFIKFVPEFDTTFLPSMTTSCGNINFSDGYCKLITKHSVYEFTFEELQDLKEN